MGRRGTEANERYTRMYGTRVEHGGKPPRPSPTPRPTPKPTPRPDTRNRPDKGTNLDEIQRRADDIINDTPPRNKGGQRGEDR